MKIIDYKCTACGQECTRITFESGSVCGIDICCRCCKKQGLQSLECEMAQLEFERFAQDKSLNENDLKGFLMEKAVSDTLDALKMPHDHNPFNNTYPCYQNKRPDIVIEKLRLVIECKNLSQKQVDHTLSQEWLDENIVKRPYFAKYRRKIAFFSYKPRQSSVAYLNMHGWRVYGLGTQITTLRQQKRAIGKVKQRVFWLQKEYYKERPLRQEGQLH